MIAADDARFIEVFVRRGIAIDAGGAFLLPRAHAALHKAKELVFFGDDLSRGRRGAPGPRQQGRAGGRARGPSRASGRSASPTGPTFAIGLSKRLLNRSLQSDMDTCFAEEAFTQSLVTQSDDSKEGMNSFRERRKPVFRGR